MACIMKELNTKWKDYKSRKNLCTKNFMLTKLPPQFFQKSYLLKNASKTCKPNNRDLNHNWIIRIVCFRWLLIFQRKKIHDICFKKYGAPSGNVKSWHCGNNCSLLSIFAKRSIVDVSQDSEYASGSECASLLNIPGFWICEGYTEFWICL